MTNRAPLSADGVEDGLQRLHSSELPVHAEHVGLRENAPHEWPKPWFTLADAERIIAADGRARRLTEDAVANLTDGLNAAAHSLVTRLVHARDHPPRRVQVNALKRLASVARSFAVRASEGAKATHQAKAVFEICLALPAGAMTTLLDAAAGDGPLLVGQERVLAAWTAIERRSSQRDAETSRLAGEAALKLAEWAMLAAGARPIVHPEREGATAVARGFALLVMEILASATGRRPGQGRRSDAQSEPGSPTGPTIHALKACFAMLREACRAGTAAPFLADYPALNPGPEMLFEWIRAAQGKPRRLRGPVRKTDKKKDGVAPPPR